MKLPYVISEEAASDLEAIWLYTLEQWSLEQANRYHRLITDEIHFICKRPNCGVPMDHVRDGYRAAKVKSHLIFYHVVNDIVEIVRILHERMDIERRLKG